MTTYTQPEALRLAAWLNEGAWHQMRLLDVEAAGRELRRLHAENETLKAAPSTSNELVDMAARLAASELRANQLEALRVDAARYRWWLSAMMMPEPMDLMERTFAHLDQDTIPTKAQFDEAIDAAIIKGGE